MGVAVSDDMPGDERGWRLRLTPEQFHILREKGTEEPFSGEFYNTWAKGSYLCAGCGAELFKSTVKFASKCGWPSFYDAEDGRIRRERDTSHNMERVEVLCAECGGHLGHVFRDGPPPTGERYCINSLALQHKKN